MSASAVALTDPAVALGPMLRGLSFASIQRGHSDVGAGALFHLEGASPASGANPAAAPSPDTLVLDVLPDAGAAGTGENAAAGASPPGEAVGAAERLARAWAEHQAAHGRDPGTVALPDGRRWVCDGTSAAGQTAGLTPASLAATMAGRVALVTGAAQGFGWELARGLAALGAVVALADTNLEGAREKAALLGAPHRAFAVNVADEKSVTRLVDDVVCAFGGVDLLVSNAGVLRAGSVQELSLADFRFVTDVNYIGFFLMTKHVSTVMGFQYRAAEAARTATASRAALSAPVADGAPLRPYLTDIIEINSKSGLEGSNKNGAYAGSKFGGIGLVQSFALELVEQGTKVNAVCPGNFLDGPLWSDPDRGLFVQYLRAGKVPGAQTIADVRHFYEQKVPMKRGCTGTDVLRAIVYVVGQEYETGQAVPVTGGQVMLS